MKHLCLLPCLALAAVHAAPPEIPKKTDRKPAMEINPRDAKNTASGKPLPPEDPALVQFGIYEKTSPLPAVMTPVDTTLPLVLKKGDRVVFIGNTLFDRGAQFPHFEAMLHAGHAEKQLVTRTIAWSADEVDLMPRPANFGTLNQHLTAQKADVIFAAFGLDRKSVV